jgi:hypothetical protein
MAEKEWVYIRLKGQGDDVLPGRVTRKAYDMIHAAKGFVIVDDAEAELAGSPATQAEMAEATSGTTTRKKG